MPAIDPSEYAEYYNTYISLVGDNDIVAQMEDQVRDLGTISEQISEEEASIIHAPYTWTIKQVVGHLIDAEHVFSYRALRFASGDFQPLVGMDQNPWVANSDYDSPSFKDLMDELAHLRMANILLFRRIKPEAWDHRGLADNKEITVRALAFCMVGHITHHLNIIKKRVAL